MIDLYHPSPETSAQEWESAWWGDCTKTFGEEAKQITYARLMGLHYYEDEGRWPVYDLEGRSVLDLGGGPVSILLKTVNGRRRTVVDPCRFPRWVQRRYAAADIRFVEQPAEEYENAQRFDEAWIYNVLQHVIDPAEVIKTARSCANRIRIFEWIEKETNVGHPHTLYAHDLNQWLGGVGSVGVVNENGCYGLAYWGVFDVGAGAPWDPAGHEGTVGPAGAS